MNENAMLNELLTYAAYDTEKVIEYWNAMDYDQKIVAYTLYTSEWDYEPLECVEIAYNGDYRLYTEECLSLADVAYEDFSDFYPREIVETILEKIPGGWEFYVDWDLVKQHYDVEFFDTELLSQELEVGHYEFINWEAVGGFFSSTFKMIHSDETGRWVQVY